MISYDVIVSAIQQHATQATGSEAKVREELSAIRALCDVALGNIEKTPSPTQSTAVAHVVQQPVMPQTVSQPSMPTKKIEEADANGDSLFDF